jgi:hypothetical protein
MFYQQIKEFKIFVSFFRLKNRTIDNNPDIGGAFSYGLAERLETSNTNIKICSRNDTMGACADSCAVHSKTITGSNSSGSSLCIDFFILFLLLI